MASFKQWLGRKFGLTDATPWSNFYGAPSAAGKSVTDVSTLQLDAAWACIRASSEAIGNLPFSLFEKGPDGSRKPTDHPVAALLESPNADQTAAEFWSAVVAWLLARGNAYATIDRIGGRVVALNLIPADIVTVVRDAEWNLRYRFTHRNEAFDLGPENVLHIRGFGFGGDMGLSPIAYGAQFLGAAMAADETAGKVLSNGLMPSGVFTTDAELTDEQRAQMQEMLKRYASSSNAGKAMLLEAGLKWETISLDPESMQMLQSRRFSVEQICRLFGVPPIVVGHAAEGTTAWGSGIESTYLQWLAVGLDPIMTRIERRVIKQLLTPAERPRYVADFARGDLIRTDSAARAAYLSTLTQNGLMTRNEGRRLLNLPPKPGGDDLTVQTALSPLQILGAITGGRDVQNS
ncbi:phage portal protein [Rhizobium sp. CRIBSB]|nr:phage portal protein [Rhizobium sp. CRIBSB]